MFWGIFTFIAIASAAHHWDLNDVSYLLSLPKKPAEAHLLLQPTHSGKYGKLLPDFLAEKVPYLLPDDGPKEFSHSKLRLVAFRIDPCFKMEAGQKNCQKQIRAIWQPVIWEEGTEEAKTDDASVHSFYEISDSDWKLLLLTLTRLKKDYHIDTEFKPLSIHPALESTSSRVRFQNQLNQTLLQFIGEKIISRITFTRLQNRGSWWIFAGFDKKESGWIETSVPRVPSAGFGQSQNFFNDDTYPPSPRLKMHGAIVFSAKKDPDVLDDVVNGFHEPRESERVYFEKKMELIARIENPNHFSAATMDCVHCHISEMSRNYIQRHLPNLKQPIPFLYQVQMEKKYNMTNVSPLKNFTDIVRMFGYHGRSPIAHQRVINESAEVAEVLNQN